MIALQNWFDFYQTSTWITIGVHMSSPSWISLPPIPSPLGYYRVPVWFPWVIQQITRDVLFSLKSGDWRQEKLGSLSVVVLSMHPLDWLTGCRHTWLSMVPGCVHGGVSEWDQRVHEWVKQTALSNISEHHAILRGPESNEKAGEGRIWPLLSDSFSWNSGLSCSQTETYTIVSHGSDLAWITPPTFLDLLEDSRLKDYY